jgi:hypothetical protein
VCFDPLFRSEKLAIRIERQKKKKETDKQTDRSRYESPDQMALPKEAAISRRQTSTWSWTELMKQHDSSKIIERLIRRLIMCCLRGSNGSIVWPNVLTKARSFYCLGKQRKYASSDLVRRPQRIVNNAAKYGSKKHVLHKVPFAGGVSVTISMSTCFWRFLFATIPSVRNDRLF